tara:strand:- start:92 stop:304 length:213 start_codon:yes stop_codon:yes gene_type:complete
VKVFIISVLLLVVGVTCILLENMFYQYIDSDGVLHESLLLPVGALCILLAGTGLVFVLATVLTRKIKKKI